MTTIVSTSPNLPLVEVKYTDIDYFVFTDASRHVVQGESPFMRHTYRYTPLLAYILTPNILVHEIFGKVLFCAIDILIGWMLFKMLKSNVLCGIYLFNPIVFNISTRGNADQLVAFFVICSVYFLNERKTILAAILYGVSVHFKIYPIIYAPTFFLVLNSEYDVHDWSEKAKFTIISASTAIILTLIFYYIYGYQFLFETYLYHFVRSDMRHNFSIYFYQIYLEQGSVFLLAKLVFVPQMLLQVVMAIKFHRDLTFCLFIQTLSFIVFNKVITVQYFVWFFAFLSFVIPNSSLNTWNYIFMFVIWMISQSLWLNFAYQLEFLGINTFFTLWLCGIVFLVTNVWLIYIFISSHKLYNFNKSKLD